MFGKKRGLQEFSNEERRQIEVAMGQPFIDAFPATQLDERITRLEAAAARNPSNWLYQYWLGDFYQRAKRYTESKLTADRMLELATDDPRVLYAAASIYRTLTYAYMIAPSIAMLTPQLRQRMRMMGMDDSTIDPEESQAALDELGMSVHEAFRRTIDLFDRTLTYGLSNADKRHTQETVAAVRADLQNLPADL